MKKKGWRGNHDGHKIAGQKGGKTTFERYGREYFKRIGESGGKNTKRKVKGLIEGCAT